MIKIEIVRFAKGWIKVIENGEEQESFYTMADAKEYVYENYGENGDLFENTGKKIKIIIK